MLLSALHLLASLQPPPTSMGGGGNGGGAGRPGGFLAGGWGTLGMMLLVFGFMYFVLIRPQAKQQKQREEMLKALKKGMVVRTTGGIRGEIVDLDDREVHLKIADKMKINVLRSHIAGPETEPSEKEAKDKA